MALTEAALTDEAIVERFRRTGDVSCFEALAVRHRDYVYRTVRRLVFDSEDAAELTQEVLVKAYLGLARFRSQASFRSWLRRIALNHCLNHLTRSREPDPREAAMPDVSAALAERAETRLHVRSCLERMSPSDRLILLLKYVEDLDHHEMADMLGISVSASKMRVQRAKDRFLSIYQEGDDG
jgi:RNA polymerase sigma-70 factor (ECF subfamily)